ncbi:MAG: DNA adenine methylase [Acholeplasmataceae bacterium]|nr:DNA adenine methylase [Acholeplasmataceae bacterium]
MPRTFSPLRYPGGKTQLYEFINHTINLNNLNNVSYCEAFCGGSGAAISLLLSQNIESIILNDYDKAIYSFWYAILHDTEDFIAKINDIPISMDSWHEQKNIYLTISHAPNQEYSFDLAFATFFLNRTNRAGIITGGPIGGYAQESQYDLGCRFNKQDLINKIKNIASQRDRIRLYNLDAVDLINTILINENQNELFVYFDPPYYKQGKKLYKNFFDDEKHVQLSEAIRLMDDFKWIATYDNEDRIREIYDDRHIFEYRLQYSARRTRKEKELLFHSNVTEVESYGKVLLE